LRTLKNIGSNGKGCYGIVALPGVGGLVDFKLQIENKEEKGKD
jgi:hypothetical protein